MTTSALPEIKNPGGMPGLFNLLNIWFTYTHDQPARIGDVAVAADVCLKIS